MTGLEIFFLIIGFPFVTLFVGAGFCIAMIILFAAITGDNLFDDDLVDNYY